MKRPIKPILPFEPYEYSYRGYDTEEIIYLHIEDDEWCDLEENEDYPPLDKISLQDLVNMVPDGINLSDILLEINYFGGLPQLKVFYKKNIPANPEKYKEDLKKYKKDLKEYNKKLEEYNKDIILFKKYKLQKELDKLNNTSSSK